MIVAFGHIGTRKIEPDRPSKIQRNWMSKVYLVLIFADHIKRYYGIYSYKYLHIFICTDIMQGTHQSACSFKYREWAKKLYSKATS